ncbi:unnamed protein product, partial [marine sediment metagenome]
IKACRSTVYEVKWEIPNTGNIGLKIYPHH